MTSVCSCGSGLSACVVALGLNVLGNEKTTIYDGSWSEYVFLSLTSDRGNSQSQTLAKGVGALQVSLNLD